MSNTITFNGKYEDDSVGMANGLMDVFIDAMLVCELQLAKSESEKMLMSFLSIKQQGIVGRGTVGFDIVEMPWRRDSFDADKKFILRVIQNAKEHDNWDVLEYEPARSHLMYALDRFEKLINRMSIDDVDEQNYQEWIEDFPIVSRCNKHKIIMYKPFGCKICNEIGSYYKK